MAILFLDGAERKSNSKWTFCNLELTSNASAYGFSGTYYYDSYANRYAYKTLSASQSQLYLSMKVRYTQAATHLCSFWDSANTIIFSVGRSAANLLELRSGDYSTLLATGSIPVMNNSTNLIEVYFKPLNSGGECTVKVNGATDVTYSGDTTAGLENVQTFQIGKYGSTSIYFDDIVVGNSGWIGNACIQAIVPAGAGSSTQYSPSTGSNYACVDEVTASDTDYVYTNTTDQLDLYATSNLTGNIGSIIAIDICARMAYEGTPTPTKQKIAYKSGSTIAYSSDVVASLSFADYFTGPIELNPDDSAAWEEADINALEIGVKAVA